MDNFPRGEAAVIESKDGPLFVSWKDGELPTEVITQTSRALANVQLKTRNDLGFTNSNPYQRAIALNTYENVAPGNTSIRDDFTRFDYEAFRPFEMLPRTPKDQMRVAMDAYKNIGIVYNVINMMADFTVQGIDLVHKSPRIEKIYKAWWKKVGFIDRAERFANYLYRIGNVLVRRRTATLEPEDRNELLKGLAASEYFPDPANTYDKPVIPFDYTFYNPLVIGVVGQELATFIGPDSYVFTMAIPYEVARKLRLKDGLDKDLLTKIPLYIFDIINGRQREVILEKEKVSAYYYKKDDWEIWAVPMINSIMTDLMMLKKMKMADISALDGAISHIRIWKLGDIKEKIYPTPAAIERLATMLLNNVGGGTIDLIWGPELTLQETSTDVYRFLGEEKYKPVLQQIYQGLGIPLSLLGGQQGGGFTNNAVSVKILLERLAYGRSVLVRWLEKEIALFQKAMGFREPAQVVFDQMTLQDETAELALLIQLADRELISDEYIQWRFGADPRIERIRQKREKKHRQKGNIPQKTSPFHQADKDFNLKKIALQTGQVTPGETGVELQERRDGEETMLDKQMKLKKAQMRDAKQKGQPQQGRPINKKDSTKRKQKVVKPRTAAHIAPAIRVVKSVQNLIKETLDPVFLKIRGKQNLRQLSYDDFNKLEDLKLAVLCSLDPFGEVTDAAIKELVKNNTVLFPPFLTEKVLPLVAEQSRQYTAMTGREPTLDEIRDFQAGAIALYHFQADDGV